MTILFDWRWQDGGRAKVFVRKLCLRHRPVIKSFSFGRCRVSVLFLLALSLTKPSCMSKCIAFLLFTCTTTVALHAQVKTDGFLKNLLESSSDSIMQKVLRDPDTYRCQIIYTRINRDARNRPSFQNYYFHVDPELYFNPASTVKMPLAFLSLEKLHRLHIRGVNKYTAMLIYSGYAGQTAEIADTTAPGGKPSVAQYIKRAFLVSDNNAYNRMYEFVGQQTINRRLHQKGYADARIVRQFLGFTEEENRHTNPVRFVDEKGRLLFAQPPAYNTDSFDFSHVIKLGHAHWDAHDSLVNTPMDFTRQNNLSLEDLQQMLQSVLFPASVPPVQRFDLSKDDYDFLYRYLSQYPSETNYPKYDSAVYFDSYVKFFFKGGQIPPYVRVFNKVGWSYGFLTDVSYVVDFRHRVEYMLSCTLYVNSDGVLNDNAYDYDSIGYPFFRAPGQVIYQHELSRPRRHVPDLSRFRIPYEHRDLHDQRPLVREIEN